MEKHIYTFLRPYEAPHSRSRRVSVSIYLHISFILPKAHTGCSSPFWSPINLCVHRLPAAEMDDLALGWVCPCHTAQTSREQCRWPGRCQSMSPPSLLSLDHSHCTFAFMNLAMFRTPVANGVCEFWNDTEIKGKTTCALMCKQQQLRSPTWTEKQKGKMKNRSLNSRLAECSSWAESAWCWGANSMCWAWVDGRACWKLGFLLSCSLQIPDLLD